MFYLIFVLSITFLFYLMIPGTGAFIARREWREFREKIIASSSVPVIDFQKARTAGVSGYTGTYKFSDHLKQYRMNMKCGLEAVILLFQ